MAIGRRAAPSPDDGTAEVIAQYRAQRRRETRDTTLVAGIVALLALPAWAVFDRIMLPHQAGTFLAVRLLSEIVVGLDCAGLVWRRLGDRWSDALSLLMVASPEVAIAWMIPRSGAQLEAYLLGLSLAIYATTFLVVWHWRMTVILVGATSAAIVGFSFGAHPGLDHKQLTTVAFYLVTASALAIAAQVYREQKRWQQHVTQAALEAERRRNTVLMQELEQLSREDPLTSVGNRRAWDEALTAELLRAERSGRPLSVLVFDLDRFKSVNDLRGHNVGDSVLRRAAALLVEESRPSDFVARLGGDEFAILCPDTSLAAAATLASRIRRHTRATDFAGDMAMSCSIGVAELEPADTTQSLYHRADCALYGAKTARDTVRCAEPSGEPEPTARGTDLPWPGR